ncbi:MAG: DUF1707 SHOCT-like domain-containing protein [Nannocystaceae bacterium]
MPEPVTPPVTSLVALRDRREQVTELLADGFSLDLLSEDEFERRIDLAYQAGSLAELDSLVADLELPADHSPTQALAIPDGAYANRPQVKTVFAMMGAVARSGRWLPPKKLRVVAVMGGIDLDLREAILPPGVTEIHVTALMGGVEIIVPPNVAVQVDGIAILGGFEDVHRAPAIQDQSVPQLVISGIALMGGVDVKTRLPGENAWDAWKRGRRERRERKKLAGAQHARALGLGSDVDS